MTYRVATIVDGVVTNISVAPTLDGKVEAKSAKIGDAFDGTKFTPNAKEQPVSPRPPAWATLTAGDKDLILRDLAILAGMTR